MSLFIILTLFIATASPSASTVSTIANTKTTPTTPAPTTGGPCLVVKGPGTGKAKLLSDSLIFS